MFRILCLAVGLACVAVPAHAQLALDDSTLDAQTAGFRTPDGLEFNFGAVVSTYVDGSLALRTRLIWTDQGAVDVVETGQVSNISGDALAAGIDLGDMAASGLFVPGANGGTAVLHDLGDGRIASVIANTADNRDIRQETVINLSIPDFAAYQTDVATQQAQLRIHDTVGRALETALH